ncbi:hypothetical protein ACFWY9_04495 [Amycolatopsis sp. NPDC059027]|uniref:hypothetical protein n=1 Tax=unclassified Amycolatopsis TaxID=2618356 RepID=UPI00366C4E2E
MSFPLPSIAVVPATALVLAQQQPGNGDNGGQGEDFGKSSPLGLLVLILFLIAVALLVRSMTKHLKRLPKSFDEPAEQQDTAEPGAKDEQPAAAEQQVEAAAPADSVVQEKVPDKAAKAD